jgi:hypothetical protein
MKLKSSRGALLALGIGAALAVGLAPAISSAQTAPQQLPANPRAQQPPPPPQSNRADPRGFDRRVGRFEDRLERRLDFLHSELRITPEQEQLWAAFADAVRRESQTGRDQFFDRRDAFRGGPDRRYERPGAVERLEQRQQGLEERRAYYERLLGALRPLYGALSEEQRRAADEHLFSPGRERFGRFGPRPFGLNRLGTDFYGAFDRPFRPKPFGLNRLGADFYGAFDQPFGPLAPGYDRFDRSYGYY